MNKGVAMKAAFYDGPLAVAVRETQKPSPGDTDVVVRVAACGICGTDQHIFAGHFFPTYPLIGGHELAGEIEAVGSLVGTVRVGDRVAVDPSLFCGACYFCQRNQGNHCLHWNAIGVTRNGGFADYTVAPAANVYAIGDMPYEEAAFIEPLSCVVYGLQRLALPVAAKVLIYGAGPIGLLMLQAVRRSGASAVAITDLSQDKLEVAREFGAEHIVRTGDAADDALRAIAPYGFDAVIDCTGNPVVVEHMFVHVQNEGKLLFFGVNPVDASIRISPYEVYRKDLQVLGSFALRFTFHEAIALLRSGAVSVAPLLSHRLPIDRFAEALTIASSGNALKVQIQQAW
jgi:D-arabinitol dehydrogenase (NADP+)